MRIECHKIPQGFIPVDMDMEKLKKIENGSIIELTYKQQRNYQFHKKVFAFFNYCFEFWRADREFLDERGQFDLFRNNLTVLAGYYDEYYKIDGSARVEAKSLSYDKMTEDEFQSFYTALVNCAMRKIFKDCDESYYDTLIGFF